jgi:hypothetical protein
VPRPTALGIPSPWSGDEFDPVPRRYTAWIWLYAITRRLRHRIGLHDDQPWGLDGCRCCTWCGRMKP